MVFGIDPVLLGLLVAILLVVFAAFLLLRRTATAFREGNRRGRQ